MKKIPLLSFVFVFFISLLAISTLVYAAGTIKIGIVDTYSGPATTYTLDVLDSFKMAAAEINAKGGILGKKIEYLTRDDKFKPDIGLNMAKELILKEKVDILMGTISSASALAISDFVKKEKIPFFVTISKSDKIIGEKGHRYVFSMTDNTEMAGRAAAFVLSKKPYAKYWIAGDDYEYGHAIANGVWKHLKKLKPQAKLLGETWWKVGEADFTPYITQILAAKPDFVIVATGGAGMVNFQKAAKATGFNKKIPFYQHGAPDLSTLMPQGKNAPENVYGTTTHFFYYPNTSANKAFVEKFKKTYNRYPKAGAISGYMTAQFIYEGFKKAGKVDKEALINAIEGMVLDSPVGKLELRACDHQLALPMFFGKSEKSPKYEFLVAGEIQTIKGKDYMPTCDEIMKLRKK